MLEGLNQAELLLVLGVFGFVVYEIWTHKPKIPDVPDWFPDLPSWMGPGSALYEAATKQLESVHGPMFDKPASMSGPFTTALGTTYALTTNSDGTRTITIVNPNDNSLHSVAWLDPIGPSGENIGQLQQMGWTWDQIADYITGN